MGEIHRVLLRIHIHGTGDMINSVCRYKTYTDIHTLSRSDKNAYDTLISLKHVAVNGYLWSHVVDRRAVIMHAQKCKFKLCFIGFNTQTCCNPLSILRSYTHAHTLGYVLCAANF